MTELSPITRAVLDAFNRETWCGGDKEWEDAPAIAAALRTAAKLIAFQDQLGLTAYGGHSQAQSQLLAIATELSEYCE